MTDPPLVVAAGAVVLRPAGRGASEVLLVHRPKYDDWSFPKGKLDPGEPVRSAAVREVLEETGMRVRLGPPLSGQAYLHGPRHDRVKLVHYWVGRVRGDDDVVGYAPNAEIDQVRWVGADAAAGLLDYPRDRTTLREAQQHPVDTQPLVILRHADARDRKKWKGDDRKRPLTAYGEYQAARLPPVLEAYGIERLVSSSSRRCWTTLSPYGVAVDRHIEVTDDLSEEDATPKRVTKEMAALLDEPVVVCSHRQVLPSVFEALNLDPVPLDKGGLVVVHQRGGRIVALERVPAPAGR